MYDFLMICSGRFIPLKTYSILIADLLLVFSTDVNCSEHARLDATPLSRECASYKNGELF